MTQKSLFTQNNYESLNMPASAYTPLIQQIDYQDFFQESLSYIKTEGRYRVFADIQRITGKFPKAIMKIGNIQKEVTLWCSNDYLGMGHHPEVLETMSQTILDNGAGAGGTRNISGTTPHHTLLEETLANWHKTQSALLFTSGYVANETTLSTLASKLPNCVVLSDELNHASMIQGIIHSKAQKLIFKHNDMDHLENLLRSIPSGFSKIIAAESIYSMEGDVAPLLEILNLAKKYNAFTYIDEVHAIGMYGKEGAGKIQELGLDGQFDIVQGTLGKAVGVIGGYITGKSATVDFIRSNAPGFIFTTALPPSIAAGALKSIHILSENKPLRHKHQRIVTMTKEKLQNANLEFLKNDTHIIPLIIGNASKCKDIASKLFEQFGIYVQPINYPTVPKGTERFRITPSPYHTEEDIDHLVHALLKLI